MNERTKKILVIILFILSIFAIGYGLYYMFFRSPTPTTPDISPTSQIDPTGVLTFAEDGSQIIDPSELITDTGDLPIGSPVADGGLTQTTELTTAPVYSAVINKDGKSMNFYNKDDGIFYTIAADGNIVKLSDKVFPDVEKVTWNKDAEKAVLEFPDRSKIIYNFDTESQVTLPRHWEDFSFSPTSDQLAAKSLGLDPSNRWLVIVNDNGTNVVPFQALGENAAMVQVNWSPNDQVVAFADTAAAIGESTGGFDKKIIYPVGKNQENFKGIQVEGFGFQPLWAPDGQKLLYSSYSGYSSYKPLLWVVDATASTMGDGRRSLGLNTWADKCTYASNTTLYCAVPRNLPENAGMQPSLFADLPDNLYKLNLLTGQASLVAIPAEDKTMKNLTVTKDESILYFTNAATGNLDLVKLK